MTVELARPELEAALAWSLELGADEAILDAPVDRTELPQRQPRPLPTPPAARAVAPAAEPQAQGTVPASEAATDPVSHATALADAATSLDALRDAIDQFPHCALKAGARNLVFGDGRPGSRVMIIGEAPGRDEDLQGLPFVGRAGQLLDRMLAAIGRARDTPDLERTVYITNILPWRPPQNRDPTAEEIAMMVPFIHRHIALSDPDVLVLMGNIACHALLGRRGITRLRGTWRDVVGRPALPMFHPAYLLRNPAAKREAWADLLTLNARLEGRE